MACMEGIDLSVVLRLMKAYVDKNGLEYRLMELLLGAIIAVLSFFLGAVFRPYFTGYAPIFETRILRVKILRFD